MLTLYCLAIVIAPSLTASINSMNRECPENHYWDHGLDNCEPCSLICKEAKLRGTVEECERNCPATFKAMQDQQKKPEVGMSKQQPDKASSSSSSSLSTSEIGGIVAGLIVVVAFIIVSGLLLAKKSLEGRQQPQQQANQRPGAAYTPVPQRGVQEENHHQAAMEREHHVASFCDPRTWLNLGVHGEETQDGRQGPDELVLAGSSQGSGMGSTASTSTQPVSTSTQPVSTSTQPVSTSTQPVSTSTQPVSTRPKVHHPTATTFSQSAKSSRPIYTPPAGKPGSLRRPAPASSRSTPSATTASVSSTPVTRV